MATGALFVFLFGPWIIDHLRLRQGKGQPIRTDGPQSHLLTKKGTPTMGGLMILSGLVVSTVLWANPLNPYVWIVLAVTLGFGFVGFYDDYLKVTQQSHSGFAGRVRLVIEGDDRARRVLRADPARARPVLDLAGDSVLQGRGAEFRLVLRAVRRVHHCRRRQRGQPDRRSRRARHRAGDDRGDELRHDRLSRRQRGVLGLSADQLRRRHRRTRGAVRRGARRGAGVPVVQRAAGLDLHGRHRLARARRHARLDRGRGQARDRAGRDRRAVRAGSGLGDRAGGVVQAHRQARVPDGADCIIISNRRAGPSRRS